MKKEIITAGIIGLLFGLVITGGYLINSVVNRQPSGELLNPLVEDFTPESISNIKFANGDNHHITIVNPPDQLVTADNLLTVSGQTTPQSVVLLLTEDTESIVVSDNRGLFDKTIKLIPGENQILIKSFSPGGLELQKIINVVVSNFEF